MLNENIRILRKEKGYSQETLAQELNVVRQTVSKWEKGYSVPDALMLEQMAELFEVSVSDLLGDTAEKPDDKPDLKKISEQLSVLNNQFAKELNRKRRNRKIALIVILSALVLFVIAVTVSVGHFSVTGPHTTETDDIAPLMVDHPLDAAVSRAILAANADLYLKGKCKTESHIIYGTAEQDNVLRVYLYESFSWFDFKNGAFTAISGGSFPAVYSFVVSDAGYRFLNRQVPEDGSRYSDSIEELFPPDIASKMLHGPSDEESEALWAEQAAQAQAYLESIGRTASVVNPAQ